jgi:hypothetical protein
MHIHTTLCVQPYKHGIAVYFQNQRLISSCVVSPSHVQSEGTQGCSTNHIIQRYIVKICIHAKIKAKNEGKKKLMVIDP